MYLLKFRKQDTFLIMTQQVREQLNWREKRNLEIKLETKEAKLSGESYLGRKFSYHHKKKMEVEEDALIL